jgi:hypothetical protein
VFDLLVFRLGWGFLRFNLCTLVHHSPSASIPQLLKETVARLDASRWGVLFAAGHAGC